MITLIRDCNLVKNIYKAQCSRDISPLQDLVSKLEEGNSAKHIRDYPSTGKLCSCFKNDCNKVSLNQFQASLQLESTTISSRQTELKKGNGSTAADGSDDSITRSLIDASNTVDYTGSTNGVINKIKEINIKSTTSEIDDTTISSDKSTSTFVHRLAQGQDVNINANEKSVSPNGMMYNHVVIAIISVLHICRYVM